jgi:hypothetical protein
LTEQALSDRFIGSNGSATFQGYWAGASDGAWVPRVTIAQKRILPQALSKYCASYNTSTYEGTGCDGATMYTELTAQHDSLKSAGTVGSRDLVIFVVMGAGGGREGSKFIMVGGLQLRAGNSMETALLDAVHETGHFMGLEHSGMVDCRDAGGGPFGPQAGKALTNCKMIGGYPDKSDPMGGGLRALNAYSKWVIGFLKGSVRTIKRTAVPTATSIRLFASTKPQGFVRTSGYGNTELIRVELGGETSYWIEYKNSSGYNNSVLVGSAESYAPGVYVRFRPGHRAPTAPSASFSYQAFLPGRNTSWHVVTPTAPFWDPGMALLITVSNVSEASADLLLTFR